ncbi:helix-turn-helix domain-containing protein [Seonamhaeicola marinus]|uniref:Helix-turn-helix domain-containing protein n=2 Tax=Seonamhaeicola marinus TaxID=1912246 RepID=A0A5D0HUQ5_9FLAO|nr:helix-turn-helix domain-containing protein [Seonamhaeicola marinus]
MQVICLESEALYQLVDKVVERIKEKKEVVQDKWLSPKEAMDILRITSKTTLQNLRDKDEIRFSQPTAKKVLYDRDSLYDYLERNAQNAS